MFPKSLSVKTPVRQLSSVNRFQRASLIAGSVSLAALMFVYVVLAAIPLSTTTAYTQNFDGMGTSATATLPVDFRLDRPATVRTVGNYATATTATTAAGGANLSTSASNGAYNFGSGTTATGPDRAVGFLSSGSATQSGNLYAQLVNNTGGNLSGVQISYDVEKYRQGSNSNGFRIQMYYSPDGATWTSAGADFLTHFAADANNNGFATAPGATVNVNKTLTTTVANGANLYLAWNYSVSAGTTTTNAQALAVDNVSILGIAGGGSTDPSGTGAADPNTVVAGQTSKLTVTVVPGTGPTSTNLVVTADLSTIGGSSTQQFFDDGTNGDAAIGDNVFTFDAIVGIATVPGAKSLPFSVCDSLARCGNGNISLTVQAPPPPSDHVVISQVYGGGGNTGSTYLNDYIELYNPSPTTFNLNGWSVQYASATGNFTQVTPLAGPIAPGEYYLIKLASGNVDGSPLPVLPNVEGSTNMSATNGKVVLANDAVGLTGGSSPCLLDDPNIVDFVGYGTANCREGAANAPAGSNTTAVLRDGNGTVDTNQNADDFSAGAPNPRRTAIILDSPPSVSATDTDSEVSESTPAPRDGSVAVFFSENVEVSGNWYDLTCVVTGNHTAIVDDGPRNWVITPEVNFQPGEQCTFQIFAANVKDTDLDDSQPNTDFMQANYSTTFTVATGAAPVYTPDVHLTMGNPSSATTDPGQFDNYLLVKPELSLSYNRTKGTPNWVSWHLSNDWVASLTRIDTFRPDPALPSTWFRANQFDYTNSGFDRGHMVPSADRLASLPINQATFLMDNIIPQAPINNQQTWNNMEQDLRDYLPANELYIVSGGAGVGGSGNNGPANTIANGNITVPAFVWKVALVIPKGDNDISRVNCDSRTIAVIVPNTNAVSTDWTTYLTSVDAVETLTGYDFYSNLPEPIQRCTEAGINGDNPELDTDADNVPDADDNCPLTANEDQLNTDGDSFGNACDTDDDGDGFSDTDETTAGSDPLNANSTPEICDGIDNDLNDGTDEGFTNTDGDAQADCVDTDDDNDGFSDSDETTAGSDPLNANSTPEICDGLDNDLNDGVDEGFTNTDGDGQADCVDTDDDNDGFSDTDETTAGSDPLNANSTPEICDGLDNDLNDGTDEGFTNTDGDGQADCVDADDDNDGHSDAHELACGSNPLDSGSKSLDTDGDNIPDCVDTDDDNDGVADTGDNCPLTANADQTDTDGDNIGNACDGDDDNDGVLDGVDNCPTTANANQEDFDNDGIGDVCDGVVGPPTNKDQCKNGGWQLFNSPSFPNQGACVAYVNHNQPSASFRFTNSELANNLYAFLAVRR